MNDVFVSYAREDRPRVEALVRALEARGVSVWIDHSDIGIGDRFAPKIQDAIGAARYVVVVWTQHAVASHWVRAEASAALEKDRLRPVLFEPVEVPIEFRGVQSADLTQWSPDEANPEFERLVHSLQAPSGDRPSPPVVPGDHRRDPTAPPSRGVPWPWLAGAAAIVIAAALWLFTGREQTPPEPAHHQSQADVATPAQPATAAPAPAIAATAVPADAAAAVAPTAAAAAADVAPPPAGAVPFKLGNPIDEGVPAANAGVVAAPYAQTTYVFDAEPRSAAFFRVRSYDPNLSYVHWKLTDSGGSDLFDTCLGCSTPGVIELRQGGSYRLTVGGGDAATGRYSLRITAVPQPHRVPIAPGTAPVRISDGVPAEGAGVIEAPGARDLYPFSAPAKSYVGIYVDEVGRDMGLLALRLLDSDGGDVASGCLGCTNLGVHELRQAGDYTLVVGGNPEPATGTYALRVVNVPPPRRFDLGALDGTVRIGPGAPGPGAGEIESPGALHIYSFTVPARTRIALHIANSSQGMSGIPVRLVDENNERVGDSCFGCSDFGEVELFAAGTYRIKIGSETEPGTGTYELSLSRLP